MQMSHVLHLPLIVAAALTVGLVACQKQSAEGSSVPATEVTQEQAETTPEGFAIYGDALELEATTPFEQILASPGEFEGKTVRTEATVRKNCTRKGCWMELAASKDGPGCRVTFKDYGFFVPLDSEGAVARIEGVVSVKTVPPKDVAHYESEGGTFADKQPDGSAKEIHIVATGVELKKGA